MTQLLHAPRFSAYPEVLRGDLFHVFGRMVIVTSDAGKLRAIFVAAHDEGVGNTHGVISTLDDDAGTWYVDEPTRIPGAKQCINCSRFGHVVCENKGVSVDPRHFKRRRQCDYRRIEVAS